MFQEELTLLFGSQCTPEMDHYCEGGGVSDWGARAASMPIRYRESSCTYTLTAKFLLSYWSNQLK